MADGMQHYGFGETAVGTLTVAVGAAGVAATPVGGSRSELSADLANALPIATLVEEAAAAAPVVRRIEAAVLRPREPIDLALDMRGSEVGRGISGHRWGVARKRRLLALGAAA